MWMNAQLELIIVISMLIAMIPSADGAVNAEVIILGMVRNANFLPSVWAGMVIHLSDWRIWQSGVKHALPILEPNEIF